MGNKNHEDSVPMVEFNEFLENLPVCAFIISSSGKIISANEFALSTLGYTKEELIEKDLFKLYSPEEKSLKKEMLSELEKYGILKKRELTMLAKDGDERNIIVSADAVKNKEGKLMHYIFVHTDITEKKFVDKERKEHATFIENIRKINNSIQEAENIEQMMENALNSTLSILSSDRAFLLYPCDPDAPSWSVPMAVNRPDFPGLTPGDIIPKTPEASEAFRDALNSEDPIIFDPITERFIPLGKEAHIQSQMVLAIYPKIGKPWILGVHQCTHPRIWTKEDVRIFKEIGYSISNSLSALLLLRDLRESESKFRSLIQVAPIVIIHLDPEHKIMEFNKEAEVLYGKKRDEVIGKDYFELFLPKEAWGILSEEIDNVLKGKKTREFENDVIGEKGKIRHMSWNSERLFDSKGNVIGIIAIGQDVTKQKQSQADLVEKISELESMNEKMIGREIKMVELKEEIKKLTQNLKDCVEGKNS